MKKDIKHISHTEIFETFENESIEDSLIVSESILDIAYTKIMSRTELLHYPFLINEVIIVLCTEGRLVVQLEIKKYTLEKNAVLVVLPKQVFEVVDISEDFKATFLIMKTSFWDNNDSLQEIIKIQEHIYKENKLVLTDIIMDETTTICRLIKDKIDNQMPFSRQIIHNYINILFYNIYALLVEKLKTTDKKPTKEFVFEHFIKLVERNYKQEHEILFYADKLNMTGKYLSALIRQISGKTAPQWIRGYLLMESRALLKSGKMSIQQVSNELGFYDQSHFGVFFKKYVGCSPKAYSKM